MSKKTPSHEKEAKQKMVMSQKYTNKSDTHMAQGEKTRRVLYKEAAYEWGCLRAAEKISEYLTSD